MEKYMLPCLNKQLFGVDCMGCGLQRSLVLILKGEFVEALYMYPAIYSLIILFGVVAINTFKNFNYSNKIIFILAVLNFVIIVSNFTIKTFFTT